MKWEFIKMNQQNVFKNNTKEGQIDGCHDDEKETMS